ncbi:MAG: hypothetical protein WCD18_12670 [Thermosynechococcaceae cyanobacterium]
MAAQKQQLWFLLLFFAVIGLFSGFAIWQISRSQEQQRELSRTKTDLEQTQQQMKILKDQSGAALIAKNKIQKDLEALRKKFNEAQQQKLSLEQQLQTFQAQSSTLATENSTLKIKLTAAEQQIKTLQQAFKPTPAPSPKTPAPKP